ncbi:hypothetical protein [Clostridium sp. JN-9]|uniref:hypothetical protein n=1 Tax=Clostridium sp. JN-9 TaxID=2507159 RepID=UPI000FFE217F|nr:hypothetical protein [Clostridium sp. JN-9]QAT41060.1 hypothetical protein EQM05_12725 [Clostridium sp. JN-9]
MFDYTLASNEIMGKLAPYIKKGEVPLVSEAIKIKGKRYREVMINKKTIGGVKKQAQALLYITDEGGVVTDKSIQKDIGQLAYYFNIFFPVDKKQSIFRAIRDNGIIEREKRDFNIADKGLNSLVKDKVQYVENVRLIMKNIPELRERNNNKLISLKNKVDDFEKQHGEFSDDLFKELYPIYMEVLDTNFQNVKAISTGENYYGELKKHLNKKKKSLSVLLNKNISEPLYKLDYIIGYFNKLMNTYRPILNMSTSEYKKFIENSEKNKIEKNLNLIRNP